MRKAIGNTLVEFMVFLMVALVVAGAIGGWIWNIVKLVGAVSDPLTAMFVLRCVGVFFAPLGAVLGYC